MILGGFQYLLDDFRNFHIFHQIWTCAPRIYGFTKILHQILESIWEHFQKYDFCTYGLQKNADVGKDGHRQIIKILWVNC